LKGILEMNYPDGAKFGPARTLFSSHPKLEIARIEHVVFTKADCVLAWRVFSDCDRWPRFSDSYGKIEWQGVPWALGSRLQIELVRPVQAIQRRVITVCTPPRCVAWINHVMGVTMEQWVLFDPYPGGGTRISTWIEFTGNAAGVNVLELRAIIATFLENWFNNFLTECDRVAENF